MVWKGLRIVLCVMLIPSFCLATNFYDIEIGARPAGMGGAFVGIADDVCTAYWNPSGLDEVKNVEMIYLYGRKYNRAGIEFFSLVQPATFFMGGTLGLFCIREAVVKVKDGTLLKKTGKDEITIGIGWGKEINGIFETMPFGFLVGTNIKLLKVEQKDKARRGISMDLGFLLKPEELLPGTKEIKIGFMLRNCIRTKIDEDKPLSIFKLGFGVKLDKIITLGKMLSLSNIIISMDINHQEKASMRLRCGTEILVNKKVFWRMGVNNGDFAFGMGTKVGYWQLDYSCLCSSPEITHQVSAMLKY